MRKTDFATKLALGVILAAAICYIGFYVVTSLVNPLRTTLAVNVTVRESFTVSGIVVRDESVISSGGYSTVNVVPGEGERVEAGGTVAGVYSNESTLMRIIEMETLDSKIKSFEQILQAGSGTGEAKTLEDEIKKNMSELASEVRERNFSDVSDTRTELEANILKKTVGSEDLQSKLLSLRQQRLALGTAAASAVKIKSPASGVYSSSVDGFENLKIGNMSTLKASGLESLLAETRTPGSDTIGKVVSGVRWYFAALVDDKDADRLNVRDTATMIFGRYLGTEISMEVESIGGSENGKSIVIFSSNRALADTLSVRKQSVEIICSEHSGIRVPKQALRVRDNGCCIYTVAGVAAEEKIVEILYEDTDYYIVQSADESAALRQGDEIITGTKGIYNGKKVR